MRTSIGASALAFSQTQKKQHTEKSSLRIRINSLLLDDSPPQMQSKCNSSATLSAWIGDLSGNLKLWPLEDNKKNKQPYINEFISSSDPSQCNFSLKISQVVV